MEYEVRLRAVLAWLLENIPHEEAFIGSMIF